MEQKRFILTGKYFDIELDFDSVYEAEQQRQDWANEDLTEFGEDTNSEYYIVDTQGGRHVLCGNEYWTAYYETLPNGILENR